MPMTKGDIERLIRTYFEACNAGDAAAIAGCFTEDGVHYFPAGTYGGPARGAQAIGDRWAQMVHEGGSQWAIEQVAIDEEAAVAVVEWTHYKQATGQVLRGDEWYRFDDVSERISEIRAYYATPQAGHLSRHELGEFDYRARGYSDGPRRLHEGNE